jgi:hypothetical protein
MANSIRLAKVTKKRIKFYTYAPSQRIEKARWGLFDNKRRSLLVKDGKIRVLWRGVERQLLKSNLEKISFRLLCLSSYYR